ncbi:MFS transporter [Halobacillus sp. ACCC02827]|uniref:MFS transporter n=1 Tax=Bacillaceae TaxID=186817 RepID=UPI0002A5050B|nr:MULTISPECIES: MFS transporter [Bacillaceae]ELK46204.1 putative MFS-type transporter [Halobacillus sp. BAB-2008]QHT47174.1 MFS transporter [Bacillus sp. SB49]WJE14404.1 MFS transporter [Halobacillus sp. ACCC02827]
MVSSLRTWLGREDVPKDLLLLLLIGGLYSLGIFLSSTFVNIYLWKQSNSYTDIAMYNLAIYVMQPLTFIFAGKCAKRIDRVIVLRAGVTVLSLFFMTVLIVGERAAEFNIMLGALLGIGYGFYWLAYNVLTFEITEPETRDFFNGFLGVLQSLGGMSGPLLAGFIISRLNNFTGYTVIFTISFSLFIVAVLVSFGLSRRKAAGVFSFRQIVRERKRNGNWRKILHAHVSQGFREGIFLFAVTIWIFLMTQNELSLGVFNLVYSGFSFLFYFLVSKIVKPYNRKKAIFISGLVLYLNVLLLLISDTMPLLLLYGAIAGMFFPLLYVPYVSLTYDVIGKSWNAAEMRIEYIVVREIFLNIGRVVSIIIFLLAIALISPETGIPYILLIVGGGHFFIYFFIKGIDTRVSRASHN